MKRFFTMCLGGCIGLLLAFQAIAQKPTCAGTEASYSSEVVKMTQISATCVEYEIKVSYDGTRAFGLSHYSIAIPCGEIKDAWNSRNWKMVFGKDPTTGIYGLKVDNVSGFGGGPASSFTVKFKWCSDNSCNKQLGTVAYKASTCVSYETIANNQPQPSQPPKDTVDQNKTCKEHHQVGCKKDHSPSCDGNAFSSQVVSTKQISQTCTEYQVKVSYDGTKTYGLSHYVIGIPCGTVSNVSNSRNWSQVIGKDPTTGITGLKIDNVSGFGSGGAASFTIKFTWCSDNSCNKQLGVVAYKAGQCVDYDTLDHQSPPSPPTPPQDTVTTPQPPTGQPTCDGNSFSSEIVKGTQVSDNCIDYEIKVTYDGTKTFGLSHYSIGIPCGTVSNISNSKNWAQVFGKDPTTGVYGLKIDNISGFGGNGADSFTVKFTWCSDNASCDKQLGVVSYKAGQCVDYDTLHYQVPEPPQPPQDTITTPPPPQDTVVTEPPLPPGDTVVTEPPLPPGDTVVTEPPVPPGDTVVTVPPAPQDTITCSSLLASLQKKNATCSTGNDGEISVTIQEGIEPIVYAWSNGAKTSTAQNLAPGSYSVTITDAKGNTLTLSETITSSPPIEVSGSITNPYCSGAPSGSITLTVTGGSGVYTFLWTNGSTQQNITNLASGLHTVTVTDSQGCTAQKTFMLTNTTVINATSVLKHPSCNQVDGAIDITPSGGIAPYSFVWSNGATTEDIQNVPAGNYSVKIKDAVGCASTEKKFTLRVNTTLSPSAILTPTSCLGGNSGAIDLTVSGGVPPYTIKWADGTTTEDRTNLVAGVYAVTVTDASGCSVQASYTIFNKPLQVNAEIIQPKCAEDLGSITLTVEGVPPYTYNWSNGSTGNSVTGLPPGFYSVTVTDASGCTRTLDYAILAPPPIVVTSKVTNSQCGVEGSYGIELTVSGGKPTYTFLWSNGATTQNISGLNTGTYSAAITDNGGCVVNRQIMVDAVVANWSCLIDQPAAPLVCGSVGNILTTSVTDATSYQWTVTSTDNSWAITSGANTANVVYTAGASGSTATFTLTITKNGCSQSCTYVANSCTVKDNTGGGDPSSSEPCVMTTIAQAPLIMPASESARVATEEELVFKLDVYPNPFNDKLNFEWTAVANDNVRIEIFDQLGNRITVLYEGTVTKGQHYAFDWTAHGLTERVYYYRFTSSTASEYGKLVRM